MHWNSWKFSQEISKKKKEKIPVLIQEEKKESACVFIQVIKLN